MSIRVGKTGTIRLTGKDLSALRALCFTRDEFTCQNKRCGRKVLWHTGHMAHHKARGAGGSDTLENIRVLCAECHMREHTEGRGSIA